MKKITPNLRYTISSSIAYRRIIQPQGLHGMGSISCYLLIVISFFLISTAEAQRYRLTSSEISFFSSAPMEDIEAHNKKAQSIFDTGSGEIAFVVPIKGFQFKKSLMQEHFNENYLESDKYPHAKFEGNLQGFQPDKPGKQTVTAKGELTIHGVTHSVEVPGEIEMNGSQIKMKAKFPVKVADYDIEIPTIVFYNIAEVVEVTVNFAYEAQPQ